MILKYLVESPLNKTLKQSLLRALHYEMKKNNNNTNVKPPATNPRRTPVPRHVPPTVTNPRRQGYLSANQTAQPRLGDDDPREYIARAAENIPLVGPLIGEGRKLKKQLRDATGVDAPYAGLSALGAAEIAYDLATGKRNISNPLRYVDAPDASEMATSVTKAVKRTLPVAAKALASRTSTVITAPAAASSASHNRAPVIRKQGGKTVVKHREYVNDITLGVNAMGGFRDAGSFDVDYAVSVNPGSVELFPMLASIARNFQLYTFRKLRFETCTSNGTSTPGTLALAFNPDSDDPLPTTKREMLNLDGAMRGPIWQPIIHENASHRNEFLTKRFVRTDAVPADADIKTYDAGLFVMGSSDMEADATPHIDLFVDYEVELEIPVLQEDPFPCLVLACPYRDVSDQAPIQGYDAVPLITEMTGEPARAIVQQNGTAIRLGEPYTFNVNLPIHGAQTATAYSSIVLTEPGAYLFTLNQQGDAGDGSSPYTRPCLNLFDDGNNAKVTIDSIGKDGIGVGALVAGEDSAVATRRYFYGAFYYGTNSNPGSVGSVNVSSLLNCLVNVESLGNGQSVRLDLLWRMFSVGASEWVLAPATTGQKYAGAELRVMQVSRTMASSNATAATREPPGVHPRSCPARVDYKQKYEQTLADYKKIVGEVKTKVSQL